MKQTVSISELMDRIKLPEQKTQAVSLDIGKDSIKLVQLRREGEGVSLSKIDSVKLSPVSQAQGLAQNQALKRTIVNLLAKNQITSKEIILGIDGQSAFVKFLEILPVGSERLEKTIKYEVQQQMPFSLEEVDWDAHILGQSPKEDSSAYKLLLVAVKKERLETQKNLLEGLKVNPAIFEISSLSLYNCIRFNRDYDEHKLTVVLEIGARATDLLILQGEDFWLRSFAIGGDNLTAALEKSFNIDLLEAERLKYKMSKERFDIAEAIHPVLEDLEAEITRSVEYYHFQQKHGSQEQAPRDHIDEIILSGGTAQMPFLDQLLAENFSCQVRTISPFRKIHLNQQMQHKLNTQSPVLFSQAVGLALRGIAQSQININLLKGQITAKKKAAQRLIFSLASVVLALLILFGASTFMRQDYREKNLRLQRLKDSLKTLITYQPQIAALQKREQALTRRTKLLHTLAINRAIWLGVLSELEKLRPDELWITGFNATSSLDNELEKLVSKLDLQGKAISYEGVNNFVSRLKASTAFTEVKPLSSSFVEENSSDKERIEVVKFSISTIVKPMLTPGEKTELARGDVGLQSRRRRPKAVPQLIEGQGESR